MKDGSSFGLSDIQKRFDAAEDLSGRAVIDHLNQTFSGNRGFCKCF
jgi:hypothetical protein